MQLFFIRKWNNDELLDYHYYVIPIFIFMVWSQNLREKSDEEFDDLVLVPGTTTQ